MQTRLEKAKELAPELTEEEIIDETCPRDILGEMLPVNVRPYYGNGCKGYGSGCRACWNEPYEGGEK